MTPTPELPVVEVFGPTIQGEGVMAGQQTLFIRLGFCDYKCVWCDSMHAVDPRQVKKNAVYMTPIELKIAVDEVEWNAKRGPSRGVITPWITLSGGNPAMHKQMDPFIDVLKARGYKLTIETQGTIMHPWIQRMDAVTISPKPPSSGMNHKFSSVKGQEQLTRYIQLAYDYPEKPVVLKTVVFDDADYEWARDLHRQYPLVEFYLSVGNDVGEDTTEALLNKYRWLVEKLMSDPLMVDVIPLPQLHVLIWGNRQGV